MFTLPERTERVSLIVKMPPGKLTGDKLTDATFCDEDTTTPPVLASSWSVKLDLGYVPVV